MERGEKNGKKQKSKGRTQGNKRKSGLWGWTDEKWKRQ